MLGRNEHTESAHVFLLDILVNLLKRVKVGRKKSVPPTNKSKTTISAPEAILRTIHATYDPASIFGESGKLPYRQ